MSDDGNKTGRRTPCPRRAAVLWRLCLAFVFCLLSSVLVSCSDFSAYPAEKTQPLPADRATAGEYPITIDDLANVLPDVASDLEWAVVRTTNDITALHADMITADDRPIELRAQQIGRPTPIAVQIRYGHFGDADEEAAFHAALARHVAKIKN